MSLIKVPWYVLRVKTMHFWSPSDSWDPPWSKAKPSYVHYIIRQGEAKLHILELTSVFHHLPSVSPKQLCALAHLGCTCKASVIKKCLPLWLRSSLVLLLVLSASFWSWECLAVMASTLERFRRRFPSELGWAPGKFTLLLPNFPSPGFEPPPPVLLPPPAELELPEFELPRSERTKSLEGFGVP